MSMAVAAVAAVRTLLVSFLLLVSLSAQAQSGIWGERGISRAFALRGTQLFDVDGRGVSAYDVSTPAAMRRIALARSDAETIDGSFVDAGTLAVATTAGIDLYRAGSDGALTRISQTPLPGIAHLRANAKRVVAVGGTAVSVFNVSPDGLVFDRNLTAASAVSALALKDDVLYLAEGDRALAVIDLTGANPPSLFTELADDVAVDGDTMVLASGVDGITVADVSDALAPRVTARRGAGEMNLTHIVMSGSRAYASEPPDVLRAFDISDPSAPVVVAQTSELAQVMAAAGSRLFVSGSNFDRFGIATETGMPLRALDGASLAVNGTFNDLAGPVSGVATDGSVAYVVDGGVFRVLDVSTTSSPREIASLLIDPVVDRVKLSGTQVILFGRGDVDLIDVSNPYAPRFIAVYHSLGRPPSAAAFTGNKIVEGNPWSGFHVVDFVNYSPPEQVGGLKMHYFDVASDGGNAVYVSSEGRALMTVDMTNFVNPSVTSHIPLVLNAITLVPATDAHPELLLAMSGDSVGVFSLAAPLTPVEVASISMASPSLIASGGQTVLVAMGTDVDRIDVSDPEHPSLIPTGLPLLSPMQIAVANGKTIVADRYGLRVFGADTAPPPALLHRRAARP